MKKMLVFLIIILVLPTFAAAAAVKNLPGDRTGAGSYRLCHCGAKR